MAWMGKGKVPGAQFEKWSSIRSCGCGWRAGSRTFLVAGAKQGRMGHTMSHCISHTSGFPCALTQPSPSPRIHTGNVGERFSESRNNPAPSPASLRAVLCLDSACGELQLGMSHSTCRKLELNVEVVVLWGQKLRWAQQGEKPLGRITLMFWRWGAPTVLESIICRVHA